MFKKALIVLLLIGIIFLSGCIDDNGNGSGGSDIESCGGLNQDCCEWYGRDDFGHYTARLYCNDYLDCRAGICVEGPNYQSADRP